MSDISIPGISNKYGTNELIQKLMDVERQPLVRAQGQLEQYQGEKKVWQELNQRTVKLRDSARLLYSFKNPFTERIAASSDESCVTATATRDASFEKIRLTVQQIATADRFISKSLPKDYRIEKGTYSFSVGDKTVSFNWKGGTAKEFAESLSRRGNGLIKASVIGVSKTEQSLLIESLKTGSTNRLTFGDAAENLAVAAGIIEKIPAAGAIDLGDKTIPEKKSETISINSSAVLDNYVFEYTLSIQTRADDLAVETAPTGPALPSPGTIDFKGITVHNEQGKIPLDEWTPPPIPPRVDSMDVLFLRTADGRRIPLEPIADGIKDKKITVPLHNYGKITGIEVANSNTHRTIQLTDMHIYNPDASKGFKAVNPVNEAHDAVIQYQGITMHRETNEIDDIVPGVTFSLFEQSDKPVTVEIKPDIESAKSAVIDFVGNYNRILADINILTQTNPQIITELDYFTDTERSTAEERLGTLQGDFTLNNIKTSLQGAINAPYRTAEDTTITLLSQLGISTKATGGGSLNQSRLRGYLEIDEKKLDESLKNHIPEIKDLFGFDADGDFVVDNGIGFMIDSKLQPYVQTAGIFSMKNTTLDSRIKTTQTTITRLDQQLARKEQELKRKYGAMEGTLNSLQQQSTSLDNQIKQSQNK